MKKKLFDFRLYLEGLKRMRILGIAAAILCVTASVLIPVYHMIEYSSVTYDFYDSYSSAIYVRTIEDNTLAIPALVASYLMPVFVFFAFGYLNKRNESDFYHAIPYTRTCVYVSFMASVMTWVWGILIVSCLSAGAFWAIDPYAAFSFVGLLEQMLYMCLNSALLVSFAAAAVSLMGTLATSFVAFGILLCSWRFILFMAMLTLDDLSSIARAEDVLGGYLHPSFLLPVGLVTGELNIERPVVLVYSVLVSIGMLLLGGLFYQWRRSETAGRSVPSKWLQIIMRCLLSLPAALLLTYQLITGNADGEMVLIFFVILLLIFYLYELLTTKSVKSMLKATPWLAAVLGACIVFGGSTLIANAVVNNEKMPKERITAVSIDGTSGMTRLGLSSYEMQIIGDYMTKNDEAAAIVAESLERAQRAVRQGTFYSNETVDEYGIPLSTVQYQRVWTRIRLVGGMAVTRRVLMEWEDYTRLVDILRDEMEITPIPSRDQVKWAHVNMMEYHTQVEVKGDDITQLIPTMREEWRMLNAEQKADFISYGKYGMGNTPLALYLGILPDGQRYEMGAYYYIDPYAMPRTYAILCDSMVQNQPTRERAEEFLSDALVAQDGSMSVLVQTQVGEAKVNYRNYLTQDFRPVTEFLLAHLDDMATRGNASEATVILITLDLYGAFYDAVPTVTDEELAQKYKEAAIVEPVALDYYTEFTLLLNLSEQEQRELVSLCARATGRVEK